MGVALGAVMMSCGILRLILGGQFRAPILAGLAGAAMLLGGAYGKGWADRGAREAADRHALEQARALDAARISGLAEALATAQAERERLAQELEHAALADGDAGRVALPARSVQRIDGR